MKKQKGNRNGFSLIEVMVATIIVCIVVLGGSAFCINTMKRLAWVQDQQIMLDCADNYLEIFLNQNLDASTYKAAEQNGEINITYQTATQTWVLDPNPTEWTHPMILNNNKLNHLTMRYDYVENVLDDDDNDRNDDDDAPEKVEAYLYLTVNVQLDGQPRSLLINTIKELR